MAKREKIIFTSLENVFSKKAPKPYSEDELLSFVRDPESLAQKDKAEQTQIVTALAEQMSSSKDFLKRVADEITRRRQNPNG